MNCYRCATPIPQDSRYCFACGADVSGDTAQGSQPVQRDPELEAKLADELKGDFVIERLIGRGGMAVVFLARDLQLDRKVAIKVLPPELTFGPGLIERFKREARTAATLDHPHIVPIYRIAKGGKLFWFAMKYIAGESLADCGDGLQLSRAGVQRGGELRVLRRGCCPGATHESDGDGDSLGDDRSCLDGQCDRRGWVPDRVLC